MAKDKTEMKGKQISRRKFLKAAAAGGAAAMASPACSGIKNFDISEFFQSHYAKMDKVELRQTLDRLEEKYEKKYGKKFSVRADKPIDEVYFGYALDLSRCTGCRRCIYACVGENNQSRDPQIQWINVHDVKKSNTGIDFEKATRYYDTKMVPEDGHFYIPSQCQQCEKPPCTKVCPVTATWKDPDGIVVIDYNWCIGCRYCMAACPYEARRFNLAAPHIPKEEINPNTHYLGNRPRYKGVVEKCTFCIQRSRKGKYPACVEICPAGTRKFGNMLDPESEIRQIIETKRVFRLKEELLTGPQFYYFFSI